MDIRLYMQPKNKGKAPTKRKIEDDDDDTIPESPDVQIKNRKKIPRSESQGKTKSKAKEVQVVDIFGGGPIKRTDPIVKAEKKKLKTETGIHSDDEFDKSLLDIDIETTLDNVDKVNNSKHTNTEPKSSEKPKKSSKDIKDNEKHTNNDTKSSEKSKRTNKNDKKHVKEANTEAKSNDSTQNNKIKDEKRESSSQSYLEKKLSLKNSSFNKRKFAEFLENEIDHSDDKDVNKKKKLNKHDTEVSKTIVKEEAYDTSVIDESMNEDIDEHSSKKKKKPKMSLNESALSDAERHERKVASSALYKQYVNRSGPKNLGAKEMPEGSPDCLKGCAFLLTGVLDSFEREDIEAAVKKYGGCIKSGVSKNVTHVLAGVEAGPAKMAKANDLGIKIINEDDFLEMITNSNHLREEKHGKTPSKSSNKKDERHGGKTPKGKVNGISNKDKDTKIKVEKDIKTEKEKVKTPPNNKESSHKSTSGSAKKRVKSASPKKESKQTDAVEKSTTNKDKKINDIEPSVSGGNVMCDTMWVEKYKPQDIKQIIGQHTDNSNVNKLLKWLTKWYVNRKAKLPKPSPWAKNDDGGYFKAALLSGPPGVGKTTSVALVCKHLGFDMVEFNASDTRNKSLIREQIGELLTTNSLSGYAKGDTGKQAVTKKHVLVMDEVDGMAGNEDRGGLQELIGLIKTTSVPIICMCNDRNSQKMRSLVNYCYDLRFNRPQVQQIKAAMMKVCLKENIKIPQAALTQLIVSANQDVRQTLNLLSMWAVEPALADDERLAKDAATVKKDVKLGPWDAVRKAFSAEEHKRMSVADKSDLFFYDYSLAPLFVQENYLQVVPHCPKNETLQRISKAADSISIGDLVEARIRRNQAWSLLPTQAMYSSVLPGHAMSGHVAGQIQFPGWLGKNSRRNKMHRLCQEIHAHTRLSTSGSKSSIFLDYSTYLRDAILEPLLKDKADGISKSLEILESYHLLREDLDSLTELSLWPGQRNPNILIDSKVKAAMTRTYNKNACALPYAPGAVKKRAREDTEEFTDEADEEEEPTSDVESDALIKKKPKKTASSTSDEPSTSKAKAKSKKKK